jgi:hypothetical protein
MYTPFSGSSVSQTKSALRTGHTRPLAAIVQENVGKRKEPGRLGCSSVVSACLGLQGPGFQRKEAECLEEIHRHNVETSRTCEAGPG